MKPIKPDSALPVLRGEGFAEPTYTQTPNELFAALPWLGDAELRALLIVVRDTLGYHRTTVQRSTADIAQAAGLSKVATIAAMKHLADAGLITRIRRYPVSQWRLNITAETKIKLTPGQPTSPPKQARLL